MIKIGNIKIEYPVIPAPMCGVMDAPFRTIIEDLGTSVSYSEMIASHAITVENKGAYIKRMAKKTKNNTSPFIIQIAGCNPEIMSESAKMCQDLGADIIDMNFGCPVKKVTNGHAGSALMRDEKLSQSIMEAVVNAVKIPVTVKMRMGWDHDSLNAANMAKIAENSGIQMITVHGRTRNQMYNGNADWEYVKKVKNSVKIPVIVNGDIKSIEDMKNALEKSNADGVMIGRGLYGKPWLISEMIEFMKTGTIVNKKPENLWNDCIQKHIQYIQEHYDEKNAISFVIKHLFFYSKGIQDGAKFRNMISHNTPITEIAKIAEEFFINY